MILCWAAFIAILGCMQPMGCPPLHLRGRYILLQDSPSKDRDLCTSLCVSIPLSYSSSNIYTFASPLTMSSPFFFSLGYLETSSDKGDNFSNEMTLAGLLQVGAGCFD